MESNNIELITRMVIQAINQNEKKGDGFMVPIGVSARHIHLTQEHVEALFGPGYQLTKKKELMGGQFVLYAAVYGIMHRSKCRSGADSPGRYYVYEYQTMAGRKCELHRV